MAKVKVAKQILQQQDAGGMLRRALERIIQLYTDKSHFIYELLQNAEDAGATKIRFEQYDDCLIVLHDGRPFTIENLQGLCDIGKSDKADNLNQIGEFGVGFKSVFSICETVRLYSHPRKEDDNIYQPFAVEITDFTHPQDIDDEKFDPTFTTKFVFPYASGQTFSGYSNDDELKSAVSQRLQNLGITTLLFMKNLKTIDYKIELPNLKRSGKYELEKRSINDHCCFVAAVGAGKSEKDQEKEELSFLIFSRQVAGINTDKTIDIAFTLEKQKAGNYTFIPAPYPYLSVYFPTETESKLKFIIQGPFRTTPNRSSVPQNDPDNIKLAEQTAKLFSDSILELRDSGNLTIDLLNILPYDEDVFSSAPLFECMYSELYDLMENEKVLVCKDGSYGTKYNVKIARNAELANLFSDKLLTELFNNGEEYHWMPTCLTETSKQYGGLYNFLVNDIGIEFVRPENLGSAYNNNPNFLPKRNDEWLIRLYNLYQNVSNAFSKTEKKGSSMLTIRFIKTSKGKFEAPYQRIVEEIPATKGTRTRTKTTYTPNIYLPLKDIEGMGDLNFVDENIYKECESFFTDTLQLSTPDRYDLFIKDFRRRYRTNVQITEEQSLADLKNLLHYQGYEAHQHEATELLHQYIKIRCHKDGKKIYVNPWHEKVFFSVNSEWMSIEQYYKNVVSFYYVDQDYYSKNGIDKGKLKMLNVIEDIATGYDIVSGDYDVDDTGQGLKPRWYIMPDETFRWKLNLDRLFLVLLYISQNPDDSNSMAKSNFIFMFLLTHEDMLTGVLHIRNSNKEIPDQCATIITQLKEYGAWLYTKDQKLVSPEDITRYELNEDLYGPVREKSKIYELLGFKRTQKESMSEAEKEYDSLDIDQQKQYLEIGIMREFGCSSEDIWQLLNDKGTSEGTTFKMEEDLSEFPSAKVSNWDSLRRHAAEELSYAKPVEYQKKLRSIRVTKPEQDVDSYMKEMYYKPGTRVYACQMCHEDTTHPRKSQISNNMGRELIPFYLCLCPDCAAKYPKMRSNTRKVNKFLEKIESLTDRQIDCHDPVKVNFDNESIWFTQTHVAELSELLRLQKQVDKLNSPSYYPPRKNIR